MKKPRWFHNSFVDRAVQTAPASFWLCWLALLAWTGMMLVYEHYAGTRSAFLGVLALVEVFGFAILVAWLTIY